MRISDWSSDVCSSDLQSRAAGYDVGVAKGQRLPTVSVVAGSNYFNYLGSSPGDSAGTAKNSGLGVTGGVTLAIPLFQGGRPAAQVSQAQNGSAACRERGCPYVYVWVVAGSFNTQ